MSHPKSKALVFAHFIMKNPNELAKTFSNITTNIGIEFLLKIDLKLLLHQFPHSHVNYTCKYNMTWTSKI